MSVLIFTFIIVDAPVMPATLSAQFCQELGKPTPAQQAVQHALDLVVKENSRIAIYDPAGVKIATLGGRSLPQVLAQKML